MFKSGTAVMILAVVTLGGCSTTGGGGGGGTGGTVTAGGSPVMTKQAATPSARPEPRPAPRPDCVFPDAPAEAAPNWVCDEPIPGVVVSAVGGYEKSAAGVSFQKDQAIAAARVQLAQSFKTRVTNMIKQYAETTGAGSSETVDKVNSSVSKLITSETLSGTRAFRSATSSKGTVYVLVGLDPTAARQSADTILNTSMQSERALWQEFKANRAQDELAAEIAKGVAGQ